jgi:hypothetical protein
VIMGWFAAALILSRARGWMRCPRCGTPNDPRTASCRACMRTFA